MNNIDRQYKELLEHIIHFGVEKKDRTGTGTKSIFGWQIRHNMKEGFPLLTTKKMAWKSIVVELLWFLRGDTNIKFLVDNGCHIWDGDAYKRYLTTPIDNIQETHKYKLPNFDGGKILYKPNDFVHYTQQEFINKIKTDDEFAKTWGELGPIYGKQWRNWVTMKGMELHSFNTGGMMEHALGWKPTDANQNVFEFVDQIQNLINELKTNPDSRRLMVNAWNVGELDKMVLPPCHYGFQVYTREMSVQERQKYDHHFDSLIGEYPEHHITLDKRGVPRRTISLMWNQRSVDTFLGLPFNIASYALLLEIIAKEVNMVPEELIGNLGDTHLYLNHIEQAKEQITRTPYELPTLNIFEPVIGKIISVIDNLNIWSPNCFIIENYQSHPTIKAPLSN